MPRLPPVFHQKPPGEHHVLAHRQHALVEQWPHLMRQPLAQSRAVRGLARQLDTKTDFRKSHGAHEQPLQRFPGNERYNARFRFRPPQLGKYIRVQQPAGHNSTSRTLMAARGGAISMSRCGDARSAATNTSPIRSPLSRRNSSAATTTTSSRPCTVTSCGPSLRTRRTSSLKRALAS